MKISCKENSAGCILKLHSNILTFEFVFKLQKILDTIPSDKQIALDLHDVDCVCAEFLEFLRETSQSKNLSLISLQSEILALLNLTKYDNFAPIFLTDLYFLEQKRALRNRRFSLL